MIAAISEQYARKGDTLPAAAETSELRQAALARFAGLGLPGRSLETWHYTDLGKLADRPLDFFGPAPDATRLERVRQALGALDLDPADPLCVFLDGHFLGELSSTDSHEGLAIGTLRDNPVRLLQAGETEPALVELNTAFVGAGSLVRVTQSLERPLRLVFFGAGGGIASQYRLRFELGPDCRAHIVQHFVDLDEAGEAWLNLVSDVVQDAGSELSLYRLQQHSADCYHTSLTRVRLESGASLRATGIEIGGRLVRNEIEIALSGENAAAEMRGLALTRDSQHCDTRIAVDHRAPRTRSAQDFRAIAADSSRSVFNGKVTVREDAQHIDARQRNDNLLLSGRAEIDSKPELEIYADQVACSHGATVGELSEEQLFYLRSRGIDAETARSILTAAFAEVILARIDLEDFRERSRSAVAARLPQRMGPE